MSCQSLTADLIPVWRRSALRSCGDRATWVIHATVREPRCALGLEPSPAGCGQVSLQGVADAGPYPAPSAPLVAKRLSLCRLLPECAIGRIRVLTPQVGALPQNWSRDGTCFANCWSRFSLRRIPLRNVVRDNGRRRDAVVLRGIISICGGLAVYAPWNPIRLPFRTDG